MGNEKSAREIFGTKPKPRRQAPPSYMRRKAKATENLEITTRDCDDCGETTSSFTRYFCAGCHFRGWWGRWKGDVDEEPESTLRPRAADDPVHAVELERAREALELPSAEEPEGRQAPVSKDRVEVRERDDGAWEFRVPTEDRAQEAPGVVAAPVDAEREASGEPGQPLEATNSTLSEGRVAEASSGYASNVPEGSVPAGDVRLLSESADSKHGGDRASTARQGSDIEVQVGSEPQPSPPEPYIETITPSGIGIRYFAEDKDATPKVKRHYELRAPLLTEESGGKTPDTEWVTVPSVSTIIDKFKDSGGLIVWAQKLGARGTLELLRQGVLHPRRLPSKEIGLICDSSVGLIVADDEVIYALMKQEGLLTDDKKKAGGKRGQSVHEALETWAQKGEMPDPSFFPPEEAGYIEGLRMFLTALEKAEPEVIATERMVASVKHGFAGRYDLEIRTHKPIQIVKRWMPKRGPQYATLQPGLYVPDLKTSAGVYKESHFVQLEGYEIGRIESGYEPSDARGVIHVHPGDPKNNRQPDSPYYEFVKSTAKPSAFLAMLALYREYEEL